MDHRDTESTEVKAPDGPGRDPLTERIIGLAIEVHKALGPGLLESAYEECLCYEMTTNGLTFRRQVALPIRYKSVQLDCAYRADVIVDGRVLLELKAIERMLPIHRAQLLSYLRLSGLKTGLLLNFNVPLLRDGVLRMVL